jgi:hypothetical protein
MTHPLWLCETTGQPIPLHDCLDCAEHRQIPACPFPPTVLKALANSMRGDDGLLEALALARRAGVALLRVTSLLGCTRQAWYGLQGPGPLEKPSEHGHACGARSFTPRWSRWPAKRRSPRRA